MDVTRFLILNGYQPTIRYRSVAPNPASLRSGIESLRYRVDGTLNVITTLSKRMSQPSSQDIDGRNSFINPKRLPAYNQVSKRIPKLQTKPSLVVYSGIAWTETLTVI